MPEQNFQTFRGLLRGAICTRTQAQFANDSGISASHLSRMLNDTKIFRPNNNTLHKIAAAAKNGITYDELKKALDDEDPDFKEGEGSTEDRAERLRKAAEDFAPDFKESAAATMNTLCDIISGQAYPCVVEDIPSYIGRLLDEASDADNANLPIAYEIEGDWPYISGSHSYASRWMLVTLTMADLLETAESQMVIFYTEVGSSAGNTYSAIQLTSTAVADLSDVIGTPPCAMDAHREGPDALTDECDIFEAAMNDPYYLSFGETERLHEKFIDTGAASANEVLLNAIFGRRTDYSATMFGIGFWLESIPPKFLNYVHTHSEAVLDQIADKPEDYDALKDALDKAVEEDNPQIFADKLDELQYDGGEATDSNLGYGACIAAVMASVTGFPFVYRTHTDPNDNEKGFINLSDKDCIILPEDDMHAERIQREAALLAVGRTIKELGLTSFGDLMFTRIETTFRKPRTYHPRVRTEEEKQALEGEEPHGAPDYSVLFESGVMPDRTNLYAVKLKDGRAVTLLYLKEHNIWLKRNREWSNLIEAYDPRPLRPDVGSGSQNSTDGNDNVSQEDKA